MATTQICFFNHKHTEVRKYVRVTGLNWEDKFSTCSKEVQVLPLPDHKLFDSICKQFT